MLTGCAVFFGVGGAETRFEFRDSEAVSLQDTGDASIVTGEVATFAVSIVEGGL
jgi:hypothetical protein